VKLQPVLNTKRIVLRPLLSRDDVAVRDLAASKKITDMCIWSVAGYGRKMARRWIAGTQQWWACGTGAEFGIELLGEGKIFGLIGLTDLDAKHASAELGFLLDERYWGHEYASEAAAVVVWFGFHVLKLNRIYARHLASNAASARVLTKVGMKREGVLREFARRPKGFEDVVVRAILRREWDPKAGGRRGEKAESGE